MPLLANIFSPGGSDALAFEVSSEWPRQRLDVSRAFGTKVSIVNAGRKLAHLVEVRWPTNVMKST